MIMTRQGTFPHWQAIPTAASLLIDISIRAFRNQGLNALPNHSMTL